MRRWSQGSLLLMCCLWLTSCSGQHDVQSGLRQPSPSPPMVLGPKIRRTAEALEGHSGGLRSIPEIYRPLFDLGMNDATIETMQKQLPFVSISLRRTACFGECPVYSMVLHRNGKAELNAEAYLPRLGKFVGEVHIFNYGRLCYLIENSHFQQMADKYTATWTDDSTCVVSVNDGVTEKTVSEYGRVGPIELWAIQQVLDSARAEIEWTPQE